MKIGGIICEYNPMHSGHVYHINKTKENGATHIVCAMSGNYVQRGEPAIIDKWARAEAAVKNGADLVVEIPTPWCLSSAKNYAKAGVYLLDNSGCDFLSCGVETEDISSLKVIAELSFADNFNSEIKAYMSKGFTYPSAFESVVRKSFGNEIDFLSSPNSLLAIEYYKAIKNLGSNMEFLPVKRLGNSYNSAETKGEFISASAIRNDIKGTDSLYFADGMFDLIKSREEDGQFPAIPETAERAIISVISTLPHKELLKFCGSEDIANLIAKAASIASDYADLTAFSKNKSVTMAAVKRAVLRSYLGISDEISYKQVPYIKILAMSEKGPEILKRAINRSKIPIVSRHADFETLADFAREIHIIECKYSTLYGCFTPRFCYQNSEQTHKLIHE